MTWTCLLNISFPHIAHSLHTRKNIHSIKYIDLYIYITERLHLITIRVKTNILSTKPKILILQKIESTKQKILLLNNFHAEKAKISRSMQLSPTYLKINKIGFDHF